jgi:hypothetical protein
MTNHNAPTDPGAIAEEFRRVFPYEDVAEQTAKKTADELEGRMR